eukprot:15030538-Heterocapsa_arctica.AAC.1
MQLGVQEQWLIGQSEVTVNSQRQLGHGGQGAVLEGRFCCGPVAVKKYAATKSSGVLNELR